MKITSLEQSIGATPLLEASRLSAALGLRTPLLLKLEMFNPGGSVKDRAARAMIDAAGLRRGDTIIEPTSGNTGVGLAWIAASRGIHAIFVMPENMSEERKKLLRSLGAEVVLTPANEKMPGAISKAEELRREIPGAVILGQFSNPANPAAHESTTAEEIWADTEGRVDILVDGVGTGGTLCGTARGLRRHNPALKVVATEPAAFPHRIQGIAGGLVPDNFDPSLVDLTVKVTDEEAFAHRRLLSETEGVFAGISSGAAIAAAAKVARDYPEAHIVAILPDTGERYLSML